MKPSILLRSFPKLIENWWWTQAKRQWPDLGEEKLLNLLRNEIVLQSDRFNKERSFNASSYGARNLSILAYGNFYFSRTWMAASFSLAEVLVRFKSEFPKKGPIHILDIGSGSGATGLACLSMLREFGLDNQLHLHALDYSSKSLKYLKSLHAEGSSLWPDSKITTERSDLCFFSDIRFTRNYDLIVLGYSFNEIAQDLQQSDSVDWLDQVSKLLKRQGRIIITEPAESEICRKLHTVTNTLTEAHEDLFQWAPYFNGYSCPLIKKDSKFFSHEVRKYPVIDTTEKINRPLKLEIRDVKFGFSVLGFGSPANFENGINIFRIISPVKKRKGTLSFWGIATDNLEYLYEYQRRDLSKEQMNDLLSLERGDLLHITGELFANLNRVRLNKENIIHPIFTPRFASSETDSSPTALLGN